MFDSIFGHVGPEMCIACCLLKKFMIMQLNILSNQVTNPFIVALIQPINFMNSSIDFNTVLVTHAIISTHRDAGFYKDPESSDWNASDCLWIYSISHNVLPSTTRLGKWVLCTRITSLTNCEGLPNLASHWIISLKSNGKAPHLLLCVMNRKLMTEMEEFRISQQNLVKRTLVFNEHGIRTFLNHALNDTNIIISPWAQQNTERCHSPRQSWTWSSFRYWSTTIE